MVLLLLCLTWATLTAAPADEWKSQLKLTHGHLYSWLTSDASKLCMILSGGHLVITDMATGSATYEVSYQPYRDKSGIDWSTDNDYCAFRGITYSRTGDTIVYVTPDHARPSEPFTLVFLDVRASREFRRINLTQRHPLLRSGYRLYSIDWQHRRAVVVVFRKEDDPSVQSPMEVLVRYDLNTGVITTIAGDDAVVLDERGDKWFEKHIIPSAPKARQWRVNERQFPYIICTNGDSTKVFDERTNEVMWQTAGRALGYMDGFVHIVSTDSTINRHDVSSGGITTVIWSERQAINRYNGFKTYYLAGPIGNCENAYSYFSHFDGHAVVGGRFLNHWNKNRFLDLHTAKTYQTSLESAIMSISSTGHVVYSYRTIRDTARFLILDTTFRRHKDIEILGRVDDIIEMPRTNVVHVATRAKYWLLDGSATGHVYALDSALQPSFNYWEPYVRAVSKHHTRLIPVRLDGVVTFANEVEAYLQISTSTNPVEFYPWWRPLLFNATDTVLDFPFLASAISYGDEYVTVISHDRARMFTCRGRTEAFYPDSSKPYCSANVVGRLHAIPATSNALVGDRYVIEGETCRLDSLNGPHTFTLARKHAVAMARQGNTTLVLDLRQPRFATTARLHTPNVATQTFAFADTQLQSIDSTGTLTVFDVGGTERRRVTLRGWMPRWDTLAWSADGSVITQAHQATGFIRTWNTFGEQLRELRYPTKVQSVTHITAETGKVFIVPMGNGAMYWTSGFDPNILSVNNTNTQDFDAHTSGTAAGSAPSTAYYTLLGQRIEQHDLPNHRTYIEVNRTHDGVQSTLRVNW